MNGKSFAAEFRGTFERLVLPDEIAVRFNVTERLGENSFGETFLLSEKDGGELFVLKKTANEAEILHGIDHAGIPKYEKIIESENEFFILRKYIDGVTLEEFAAGQNAEMAVDTVIKLCEILEFLHSRPAPIIHRDIKPTNIILNPQTGGVFLIDFGISRKYSEESETDTEHFGTQKFAPPEQYGFAQTDARSDIFSVGMVLRWWLTGSADRKTPIENKPLAKIAAKCTALEPDARYQTAAAVKRALVGYKNRVRRRVGVAAVLAGVFAVFVVVGLLFEWGGGYVPSAYAPSAFFFEVSQEEFRDFAYDYRYVHNVRRTDFLRATGSHSGYSVDENGGLRISNRYNNWDALDFFVYSFPPGEYILEVEFDADDGVIFVLALTQGPPWGEFYVAEGNIVSFPLLLVEENGESRAVIPLQNGEHASLQRIRLQTNYLGQDVPHPDFIVRSIRLHAR